MPLYRSKQVVITAIQFTGTNGAEVKQWVNDRADFTVHGSDAKGVRWTWFLTKGMTGSTGSVQTWNYIKDGADWPTTVRAAVYNHLSGVWLPVHDHEFIIRGLEGEFYPCDPSVFASKYEAV